MAKELPVEITMRARSDAEQIRDYIAQDKPRAADKWLRDFEKHALALGFMPKRFEIIPEAEEFGIEVRHFLFGKYRILYRVEEERVLILRVIHGARILKLEHFR